MRDEDGKNEEGPAMKKRGLLRNGVWRRGQTMLLAVLVGIVLLWAFVSWWTTSFLRVLGMCWPLSILLEPHLRDSELKKLKLSRSRLG